MFYKSVIRNLAADTKRLLYSITAKNIHKLQCYLILALIPTFNSSSFNSLIELRAASILMFYWNINPTANTPSSFWIVERSPNRLVSLAAVFSIVTQRSSPQTAVCGEERCVTILKTAARETTNHPAKNMVSFTGQKKLGLRPDRSPLGV